jgi:hypothetical protein
VGGEWWLLVVVAVIVLRVHGLARYLHVRLVRLLQPKVPRCLLDSVDGPVRVLCSRLDHEQLAAHPQRCGHVPCCRPHRVRQHRVEAVEADNVADVAK